MTRELNYAQILREHYVALILATLVGCAIAFGLSSLQTEQYTGVNKVFVSTRAGSSATDLSQGGAFAQGRVASYAELVTSRAVLEPVADDLDYPGGVDALVDAVSASTDPETVIIDIEATDEDPARAAEIANAVAAEFADQVSELELPNRQGEPSVAVASISTADPPTAPSAPNQRLWTLAGGLLALLLTWLALLARTIWSTSIISSEDLEEITGAPMLGSILKAPKMARLAEATMATPTSAIAEAYRQIKTNLRFLAVDRALKSVAVVSALPGEGKSTVAANLAEAMSEGGNRVLLVDADLRRPSIGSYLGLDSSVGLSSVLTSEASIEDAVQVSKHLPSLSILPSGPIPPNPSELVGSEAMEQLLGALESGWDVVVFDTPPLLAVTDGLLLATRVDVALLVVRQRLPKREQVQDALRQLAQLPDTMTAVVFNAVSSRGRRKGRAYEYYGGYSSGADSESVPDEALTPS